ncbi:MAG: hypothetical protein U9R19_15810 [Bacteroidota bacterium]|nr:hypothetical protein [Bacteroidota bacterium]
MKKTFTLMILLFALSALWQDGYAQETINIKSIQADARINDAFGNEFVERIRLENPNLVLYYNFFLDNSYYFTELPGDKTEFLNSAKTLPIAPGSDKKVINVLKFKLNLKFDQRTYFRLSESNKVMVFYSGDELNEKYNEHRRMFGLLTETETK